MNVVAIGLDAADIPRFDEMLRRYGDRFLQRVYTEGEIAYCMRRHNPAPHLAARFAAKEAAMKALGTGRALGVLWREIEVVRHGGPPQLTFHGTAAARFTALGATRALLTITHAQTLALSQVMFVRD